MYLDKEQRVILCQATVALCFGINYPKMYSDRSGKSLKCDTEDLLVPVLCKHLRVHHNTKWVGNGLKLN